MPLGLHPDHHIAFPGGRAILLELASDRYRRLTLEHSSALRAVLADPAKPDPAAVQLLISVGLLSDHPAAHRLRTVVIPQPALAPEPPAGSAAPPSLAAILMTVIALRYRLRQRGLKHSLDEARRRAVRPRGQHLDAALALAERIAALRKWLPLPAACLPDGLALHALLCRAGIAAHLVIGVRDRPFAAHCWVQVGATVLSDPSQTVAELTPILVL